MLPPANGPTLLTPRLLLRPPIQDDLDGYAAMAAEEETMRFIGGLAPRDVAWRALATMAGSWQLLGFGMFSVIHRETGAWLGRVGPWRPAGRDGGWPGDEVGWAVLLEARGHGYAAEAAAAGIDWAFDVLGWEHVIHCIDRENTASIALAQRLGSTRERTDVPLPPPFSASTVDIYGQSRDAWRLNNPRS
jgi:RimJ/RimL family protein N-acetyltransferase